LSGRDVDRVNEEATSSNLVARHSTDRDDRKRAYRAKVERIAKAILRLDPKKVWLNYQVRPDGELHVLTTILGSNVRAYHTPFWALPGLVQLIAVERLGNPYVFLSNWRSLQ
jgi:hypothetical protein